MFVASRAAAVALFGDDGLREIAARLSPDVRGTLIDSALITEPWLPERFVMAMPPASRAPGASRRLTASTATPSKCA